MESVPQRLGAIAELLRSQTETERDKFFLSLGLTSDEKEQVRKLLLSQPDSREKKELCETEEFRRLVQDVRRGKAVLFIGAGVAQDVGLPGSGSLTDALRALARDYHVPGHDSKDLNLPKIAGLLDRAGYRRDAFETIKRRVEQTYQQTPSLHRKGAYRLIPYLGELNRLIMTTNWDELLERAFGDHGEPAVVVLRDQELGLLPAAHHAIVKLHGDFSDPETLVVSDNDYMRNRQTLLRPGALAGSMWGLVSSLLGQFSCIFVGYRAADDDFKLIQAFVASRRAGEQVRNYMVGPFDESERRGLKDWVDMNVIQATAGEFFLALAQELAEFANRRDDLDRIFRREASLFTEFFAPFEAGKHALLDEIERRAKAEGWHAEQLIRIDLRQNPPLTYVRLIERMAEHLGVSDDKKRAEDVASALQDRGRLLIIFEHTEAVESGWPDLISFVTEVVAPVVKKLDRKGSRSRLILSGRYPVYAPDQKAMWPISFKRDLEAFPLSPFTLSGMREMVGKHTLLHDQRAAMESPTEILIEQIYEITGRSHPGFVKRILDDLLKKVERLSNDSPRLPPALTEQEIDVYLDSFDKIIMEKVWMDVDPRAAELFKQGLCVLRRLNRGLLTSLETKKPFQDFFKAANEAQNIHDSLRKRHLLAPEFPLEVVDPIVRRIQTQMLRRDIDAGQRYAAAHEAAATAWEELLPHATDTTQLSYFREWLYHRASCMQADGRSPTDRWYQLQTTIDGIIFRSRDATGMGEALLREIEEQQERDRPRDGELLDLLTSCLGPEYYEKLRELLQKKETTP